jgi:hypothetical protein
MIQRRVTRCRRVLSSAAADHLLHGSPNMSEILLNVLDAERSIHSRVHGNHADRVIAALSADPESIEDLDSALGRYMDRSGRRGLFEDWNDGVCPEPWDAGIVWVDLPARLVASDSTYSSLEQHAAVLWPGAEPQSDLTLPYHLSDEWLLTEDVEQFERLSQQRRAARQATEPLDARAVAYGRLPEFVVRAVDANRADLADLGDAARDELIRDIHARWLLEPRHDLRDQCLRSLLIDDRHRHIVWDLQHQQQRWSALREPPPGIARESAAYRFGGFGTHEIVLYYDLVRELLSECVARMAALGTAQADLPAESEHLQQHLQDWMNHPHGEFHDRTPQSIIDRERRRLPECISGEEAVIDHDCPMCEMMADEQFGPGFWYLDGCNMDDDFAFSFHNTREEWEAEQREFEERNRTWEAKRQHDEAFIGGDIGLKDYLSTDDAQSAIWQTSYSDPRAADALAPQEAVPLMLFAVGAHLCELGENLQERRDIDGRLPQTLRALFTQLRHAIQDRNSWLVPSAVAEFSEALEQLAHGRPELAAKCTDLEQQLDRLLDRCRERPDADADFPF